MSPPSHCFLTPTWCSSMTICIYASGCVRLVQKKCKQSIVNPWVYFEWTVNRGTTGNDDQMCISARGTSSNQWGLDRRRAKKERSLKVINDWGSSHSLLFASFPLLAVCWKPKKKPVKQCVCVACTYAWLARTTHHTAISFYKIAQKESLGFEMSLQGTYWHLVNMSVEWDKQTYSFNRVFL